MASYPKNPPAPKKNLMVKRMVDKPKGAPANPNGANRRSFKAPKRKI